MPPPTVSVLVDWDNNGNFTTSGDDITADVGSPHDPDEPAVTIARGGTADFGSGLSDGSCTIQVRNDTGKYTRDNASSPLFGKVLIGRPVWITATYSAVTYGLFAGHLTRIVPDPASRMATLVVNDALVRYGRLEASVTDSTTRSLKEYRTAILDAIGESASRRDLAEEPTIPGYTGEDTASALDLLAEINQTTLSRHFARPGTAMPAWYLYTTRDRHYKLDQTPTLTIGELDVAGMVGFDVDHGTLINDQFVAPGGRVIADAEDIVWQEPELPVWIGAGNTRTFWARFSDPVIAPRAVIDATNAPGVVLTPLGRSAKIVVTAGGSATKVSGLAVYGRPASRGYDISARAEDATSITTYGGRYLGDPIDASLAPTLAVAQGVADHMVYRFKDPRTRPRLELENLWPQQLQAELFEPMLLTWSRLALTNRRFEITGLELSISGDRNTWRSTWQLQEPPSQSVAQWFKVGGSAAEGVGGAGILAY